MNTALKLSGAEKFGTIVKVDKTLTKKSGASSFPKKVAAAKAALRNLKQK